MSLLNIIQLGHPTLRQLAQPVTNIASDPVQQLIDSLMATAQQAHGVGIAAPQVNHSDRLFIVASRPNLRYPQAPTMSPTAMINPELVAHGEHQVKGWEGCLSVPSIRGQVPRYTEIEVAYWDRWGDRQQQILSGFVARIFQHELDHLNGLVFLDRVESTAELVSEQVYSERQKDEG
ncbi:MAG: peptide deformylase [Leptolyngbyaceae cyanobacterium SM1_1_3]|nr:peptide deformylase [Leptolyngbyaceae cyanobacterium SM1_1_3]NJN03140.1 peptide deformylase [Leptolyngbyaceae cyanobacterium RM1_1_2]NJO09173.1 peptide deformylase [Leptolyngbyaceae cyanobacterium SL_1_1]